MSLVILNPGPLTTVQDAGRIGFASDGFRACGAADSYAYKLANALIGNTNGEAVLETTLCGPELQFTQDTVFAMTGAEASASLNGLQVPFYQPLFASAGSVLKIGTAATGLRSYLAVGGGIATEPVLGSRATDLKCTLGGFCGRALTKGDNIPVGENNMAACNRWNKIKAKGLDRPLHTKLICTARGPVRFYAGQTVPLMRCVAGPQMEAFTLIGQYTFTHSSFTLTPNCDRMACKLKGNVIETVHGSDILSDGIAAGSVQISADGQPIVMIADHQTTGGYAKIATVIHSDLSALAQLRPGQQVAFDFVTPQQAIMAARTENNILCRIAQRLN